MKVSEEKVWLKHYPADLRDLPMDYRTIYDSLCNIVKKYENNVAIYYYGTKISYSKLLSYVDELANAFYAVGVREGELVSVLSPTTPETIITLYALNKIGAIPNFVDPRMDTERIFDAVQGVGTKIFLTIDVAFPKVKKIKERLNVEKIIVAPVSNTIGGVKKFLLNMKLGKVKIPYDEKIIGWNDFVKLGKGTNAAKVDFKENSVAAITYTGGTTGTPKGVMLTNDGLNTMADSMVRTGVDQNSGDRFLEIMPIFASYGVGCGVHMPLSFGFELIVIPKFTPNRLGFLIRKYKPNHMMAVPSFYEQIMHSRDLWDFDLSFLKTTGCGGETMNVGLEERFNKFLREHGCKYPIAQGYGMSEMSGGASACFGMNYKDGSAGIPFIATIIGSFDPETNEEKGYNEQGEICMRGRNMMLGYYNNEDETNLIMRKHADGNVWIHSGDIGHIDEDGFLFIDGRIKQIIIKFDGHKVFPVSIESVINRHKAVGECAVVGIPDKDHAMGEVPLGIVELKSTLEGDIDKEVIRKEILNMCNELCEERGRPADIVFIPEMLHTGLNKHDYRRLAEQYHDYVVTSC